MRKKQKQITFIVGIIIALALIFFVNNQFLSISVLSISNVDIQDYGSRLLVYARQGGGQELSITFDPSTINNFIKDDGYQATKSSTLTAKYVGGQVNIPFSTYTTNSLLLLKNPNSFTTIGSCDVSSCINKGYAGTVATYTSGTIFTLNPTCNCVQSYVNGYINSFNTGFSSNKFTIDWYLDGEKKTMTQDSGYVIFNDNSKVRWEGSLLSNNLIGVPNYDVFHVGSSWYLIDKNAYTNVKTAWSNFLVCTGNGKAVTETVYKNCLSQYYSVTDSNIISQDDEYISATPGTSSISFSNGLMSVNLNQPTFLPTYTIELNANRVLIVKLSGIPQITSCVQDQIFEQAGSRSISTTVKNIGTSEGSFLTKITCSNPLISGGSQELDFMPSETKTVTLLLNGGNTGTTTNSGVCTIEVKDVNSGQTKTCNFDVDVKYFSGVSDCVEGEKFCSPDSTKIISCIGGEFNYLSCQSGTKCSYINGDYKCVSSSGIIDDGTGECNTCWGWLRNSVQPGYCDSKQVCGGVIGSFFGCISCILYFVKVGILAIITLIGYFITQGFLNKISSIRNIKGMSWILALIIIGIISTLLYIIINSWLFYLGIGLVVFYFIFINFIPVGKALKTMKKVTRR